MLTDYFWIRVLSDGATYNNTSVFGHNNSVLCEPWIPLEGNHTFSAIYTCENEGSAFIGFARWNFLYGNWLLGPNLNSWGYAGLSGDIFLNGQPT